MIDKLVCQRGALVRAKQGIPQVTHDLRGLLDKPGLGLVGMQGKKLSHDSK